LPRATPSLDHPFGHAQHIWPLLETRIPQWVASGDWQRRLAAMQVLAWAVADCPVKPAARMKALAGVSACPLPSRSSPPPSPPHKSPPVPRFLACASHQVGVALTKDSHIRVRCGALVLLGGLANMNSNSDEAQKLWSEREAGVFGPKLSDEEYLHAVCGEEVLDAVLATLEGDDEAQWAVACDAINSYSRDDVAAFETVSARGKETVTKLLGVLQRARTPAVSHRPKAEFASPHPHTHNPPPASHGAGTGALHAGAVGRGAGADGGV
jgi:hypothetical protein